MLQAGVKGVCDAWESEGKVRCAETTGHINYAIPYARKGGALFFILLFGPMEEEHGLQSEY